MKVSRLRYGFESLFSEPPCPSEVELAAVSPSLAVASLPFSSARIATGGQSGIRASCPLVRLARGERSPASVIKSRGAPSAVEAGPSDGLGALGVRALDGAVTVRIKSERSVSAEEKDAVNRRAPREHLPMMVMTLVPRDIVRGCCRSEVWRRWSVLPSVSRFEYVHVCCCFFQQVPSSLCGSTC
jgi:hypothetical protein